MSMISRLAKGTLDTSNLLLEQKLNSLFYLPVKPEIETQMIMNQAKQDRVRTGLHLSAIMASEKDFCYREQVLSLFYHMAQGENIHIDLKRIFEAGTSIGEKWQRLFLRGDLGKLEDMDISRFRKEYDLSYTPDATIVIGKKKYVVEIKSQNTFIFQKSNSHPAGKKQLQMYMYLDNVKDGFVLVEDKNNQKFKIYREELGVTFDKDDIIPYIERLEQIQIFKEQFLTNKKPPDRICKDCNVKRAKDCNMRDVCFNIGGKRKSLRRK